MWIDYQDCKGSELLGKMNIVHHIQAAPTGNSGSGLLVQETKVCSENLNIESSKLDVLSGYSTQESEGEKNRKSKKWTMLNKPERISLPPLSKYRLKSELFGRE